ncbi:uncharacterized protein LOC124797413 [Schistocerca piceifrons]|uniref:uncharacterized protein LOC124797413 n=1 Tax=Schistocerca piceifrons TaxID=274613 RepID=UPI001F5FC983|nr:uncharacterized protein LOC124797413 [Schistocerca piceifrons]
MLADLDRRLGAEGLLQQQHPAIITVSAQQEHEEGDIEVCVEAKIHEQSIQSCSASEQYKWPQGEGEIPEWLREMPAAGGEAEGQRHFALLEEDEEILEAAQSPPAPQQLAVP